MSESNNNKYTVGWICAISAEYTAAQCFLDERHDPPEFVAKNDENDYTLGRMGRHNVVIAVLPDGEYGISSATAVAKDMLHSFPNVRIGLMVGIGGGAPTAKNDIRLGDIVISSASNGRGGVFQYDMGKAIQGEGFQQTGFLNKPPRFLSTAVQGLKSQYDIDGHEIAETIDKILEKKKRVRKTHRRPDPSTDKLYVSTKVHEDQKKSCASICGDGDLVQRPERDEDEGGGPAIFYGLIASANQVMKDAIVRDRLAEEEGVLCFEMEAAGLMNLFPCLVVRGICDYSDSHKNKAWQGYAAMTAAAYTKDLLKRIPPNKIEEEKRITQVLAGVQQGVAQLSKDVMVIGSKLDKSQDQAILDWIAPDDYGRQQSDNMSKRQPGTGQWLLDRGAFQTWLSGEKGSLFCQGMPGAGKTILTAVVVDHLLTRKRAANDDCVIGVAFLYCSFSWRERQTPEALLLSVLKHLSQGLPSLPESVKALYQAHQGARTRPFFPEIVSCLESTISQYKKTFIVVDALDECPSEYRPKLLTALFRLRDGHGANIFATSRPHHEIETRFPKGSVLEIKADSTDIKQYLDAHMSELPGFVGRYPDLQNMIKEVIITAVCGMFLLAQLYFQSLVNKQSRREIESALANRNKTYEKLYEDTIKRIERSEQAEFARKALSWVVCARRPLTTPELLHALAVNPGDAVLDEYNIAEMDGVMSACAGLVTVDEGNDVVRLIHYTAQEYLGSGGSGHKSILPDVEAHIAGICLTYLCFDEFEEGFCATDADLEARLSKHPLYVYAARNWGYYAREISFLPGSYTSSRLHALFSSPSKTDAAAQALLAIKEQSPWPDYSQEVPRGLTGLHLAAHFNATNIAQDLLQMQQTDCNVLDSHQQTPLMWAVSSGHLEMVQLLLDAGADPNLKNKDGRTALSLAAEDGLSQIVDTFLKDERLILADDAQRDAASRSPLSWAARNGHIDVVRLLLARSTLDGGEADNPLLWAILHDSEAVVKIIVQAILAQDPAWAARIAPKALCWTAGLGHVPIFTYLLSTLKADVNCRGDKATTPLMEAVLHGHEEMATTLLTHLHADPALRDTTGRTAFSLAAAFGHDTLLTLLLNHPPTTDKISPLIDLPQTDGRTPLSLAAGNGHTSIVQTLLKLAVNADARDRAGQTPLYWAASNGHEVVVRALLETGDVDVNAVTVWRKTALSEAVRGYHVGVVRLLREFGAVDLGEDSTSKELVGGCFAVVTSVDAMEVSLDGDDGDGDEEVEEIDYDYHSGDDE